jgi:hypothetical protein
MHQATNSRDETWLISGVKIWKPTRIVYDTIAYLLTWSIKQAEKIKIVIQMHVCQRI